MDEASVRLAWAKRKNAFRLWRNAFFVAYCRVVRERPAPDSLLVTGSHYICLFGACSPGERRGLRKGYVEVSLLQRNLCSGIRELLCELSSVLLLHTCLQH